MLGVKHSRFNYDWPVMKSKGQPRGKLGHAHSDCLRNCPLIYETGAIFHFDLTYARDALGRTDGFRERCMRAPF